jgi:2-oxoglutarate/2-oxoacid ferredoxin oxidoreductase subunit beta
VPSIAKPAARHPSLERNSLGLTIRDYEGAMSTLCAGCGHDSVTAAIIRAVWELALSPHMIGKFSGIGCSSKTPTYFVSGAHGFNSAHGRMPAIATGANAANREIVSIGISGDGDSLSIGIGHMVHAIRRNVNILYVIENNGVYGLTKGQFSASADVGSKSKRGEPNRFSPIDPVSLGLSLGATFIARGFSGDKEQLVPILKAGIAHRGLALVDVISPCVTFNDHEGSTKSYLNTRKNMVRVTESDMVVPVEAIHAPIAVQGATAVTMHDGTVVNFTKVPHDYDPRDRTKVYAYLQEHVKTGCVPTGLLFIDENAGDVHDLNNTTEIPLSRVPFEALCPGAAELDRLQEEFR